jgi:hypothetical protein
MHDGAPLSLVGVPPATLQTWLLQAQTALQALNTGAQVTTASYAEGNGQRSVTYRKTDVGALHAWIGQILQALHPGDHRFRRRAISVSYGPSWPSWPWRR